MKIPVVVITGPTASGKTGLGVELALRFGGEVVSADSMQVYKKLDIGTAKPTMEERRGVVHHMIDVAEPWESYSVARYCEEAKRAVLDVNGRGKLPIVVGGTGLYIDNLIANTDFSAPGEDSGLRSRLAKEAEEKGADYVHGILREMDPAAAEKIHPNNLKRVIRAIELVSLSGESRESLDKKSRRQSPFIALRLAIGWDRAELYERINSRVDLMLAAGLAGEVERELLPIADRAPTASQAIGYKEMLACLRGEITLGEAAELIKRNSRRYAKRQLTWLGKNKVEWLGPSNAVREAEELVKNFRGGE